MKRSVLFLLVFISFFYQLNANTKNIINDYVLDEGDDIIGIKKDRAALIEIYKSSRSKYLLPSWDKKNIPIKSWEGVTTDIEEGTGTSGRVIKLNLNYRLLHELNPAIGELKSLEKLDLGRNDLSSLPNEIFELSNLTDLYVDYNFLDFNSLIPIQNIASNFIFATQIKIPVIINDNSLELKRVLMGKEYYQWYCNDKEIPGENKKVLENLEHGNIYYCKIKNQNFANNSGFEVESESIFIYDADELGNENIKSENKAITIYPNPIKSGNDLMLTFNIPNNKKLGNEIYIFDLNGRLIKRFKSEIKSEITISTKGMKKGLYIIKYAFGSQSITKKIIID